MERAYIFITVTAPAATDETTFQCFVANSEQVGQRLRAALRATREHHGFPLLQTGFCTKEGSAEGLSDTEA